ncbi:MAG: hypothetical protein GY729_11035, partial [Desulfobacteraceae bacterium]|nr:hypothetical protein [Desulfobacteraceae bacterium]
LPSGAIFIDFFSIFRFFKDKEIDDNLSKWFWRFTICVGVNCSEKSAIVTNYSKKLKSLIIDKEDHVQKIINEYYEPDEAVNIFDWWIDTLDIMVETAGTRNISNWRGIPIIGGRIEDRP